MQDDARTNQKGGGELAEAGIEGQRQYAEQHVVRDVVKIAGDALGAGDKVAVGEYDTLRLAGAA